MRPLAVALLITTNLGGCAAPDTTTSAPRTTARPELQPQGATMVLGAFSVSLAVKDIAISRAFYEKLGFAAIQGQQEQGWLILRNGVTTIGLFQDKFEKNILTFNPGWTSTQGELESFQDVRELQRELKKLGVPLAVEADETTTGPASFVIVDPDGNPILVDQHVNRPDAP